MADAEDEEKQALLHFLRYQRDSVLSIVQGLDEQAWHQSVVPSGWTPAGLVEHLGEPSGIGSSRLWPAQMPRCPGMRTGHPMIRRQRSSATGPRRR
jgi:hypothetical protein